MAYFFFVVELEILPLGMIDGKTISITEGHYALGAVHAGVLGCA